MSAPDSMRAPKPTPRLPIEPHLERNDLVIWRHRGRSQRLVLSFSGIGSQGEAVPPYEFAKIATNNGEHSALFIIDPKRTWLNGDGLIEQIVEAVDAYAKEVGADEIVTLGHSMGGFAAIVLSGYLPVKTAIALSPQFSVHPDIVGDDPRWMYFRKHIKTHRLGGADAHMNAQTTYHVFHGGRSVEHPQRDRFPMKKNLYHTVLPKIAHRVPQKLKDLGLLERIMRAAMNDRARKVRLTLEPLGAHRRTFDRYPALGPSAEVAQ